MDSTPWDPHGEALSALRAIVADPQYGAEALSNAPMMTNLLKDLLPDAPREANVLITAAGAGVPAALQGYMAQGMDLGTASRLAAADLAERTALTADACARATGALAAVLFTPAGPAVATASAPAAGQGVAAAGPTATVTDTVADTRAAGAGPGRRAVLSLGAASGAGVGALATILACAFSFVHVYNADGTYAYSESLFSISSHHGGAWYWIGPVAAAALSAGAAVVLAVSRGAWLGGAAAGLIAAFGVAVLTFFAAYQFTLGPVSTGTGPAGGREARRLRRAPAAGGRRAGHGGGRRGPLGHPGGPAWITEACRLR